MKRLKAEKAMNNLIISGLNTKNKGNYGIFGENRKKVNFRAPLCELKILPIEL